MAPPLPDDFREFLKSCNAKRVRYLVVGGYAVVYYGYPRNTIDIDVWIERSEANAERMVAALKQFGFNIPTLTVELFLREQEMVRMGNPPLRIEVLNDIDGVMFEECYERRLQVKWMGIKVPLISFEDLIRNKTASARHKDLDDIEKLTAKPFEKRLRPI